MSSSDTNPTPPAGARLEYAALPQVDPKQLYMKLFKDGELVAKVPLGIYKFEAGKLVICQAREFRTTLYGFAMGDPEYEFPSEFSGDCMALDPL